VSVARGRRRTRGSRRRRRCARRRARWSWRATTPPSARRCATAPTATAPRACPARAPRRVRGSARPGLTLGRGRCRRLPSPPEPAAHARAGEEGEAARGGQARGAAAAAGAGGAVADAAAAPGAAGGKGAGRPTEMGGYPCDTRVLRMTCNIAFDFGHSQVPLAPRPAPRVPSPPCLMRSRARARPLTALRRARCIPAYSSPSEETRGGEGGSPGFQGAWRLVHTQQLALFSLPHTATLSLVSPPPP
jgi:hypothetical protein